MNDNVSRLAPKIRMPTTEEIGERFLTMLQPYCLQDLGRHSVVLEGWTDVSYVEIAVSSFLNAHNIDLGVVPDTDRTERIHFCTPGKNGDHRRGGTPQMVRLARDLNPFVFTMNCVTGIIFVFDHDAEGLRAQDELESEHGYKKETHTLSLNPKLHPGSNAKKQVCIEDLLSLDIQNRFFSLGNAYCDVVYEGGKIVRYKWGNQSKSELRDFVKDHAELSDVTEIVNLVKRIRSAWGYVD